MVAVSAADDAYKGDYFVRRVTHVLRPGTYTQSFALGREGTGAMPGAMAR